MNTFGKDNERLMAQTVAPTNCAAYETNNPSTGVCLLMNMDSDINIEGTVYRIIGFGVQDEETTTLHVASKTKGQQQKNGWCPSTTIRTVVNEPVNGIYQEV